MSAKFGYNIRTLANNNFLNCFNVFQYKQWKASTSYAIGDKVYNGGYRYICNQAGESGQSGPSSANSPVTDNTVEWIFLEEVSKTEIFGGNLYFFIGKLDDWTDPAQIPLPDLRDVNSQTIFNDIASLKRIEKADMRAAIKLYTWVTGSVYSQYDPNKNPLAIIGDSELNPESYENPFYCINSSDEIFKCLNNDNNTVSTVMPTKNTFRYTDNYVWKYMGTINQNDEEFKTNNYVPVSQLIVDDGSDQWDIQNEAKNDGISSFKILNKVGKLDPTQYTVTLFRDDIAKLAYPTTPETAISVDVNNSLENILAMESGENYTPNCVAVICHASAPGSGAYTYDSNHTNITDGRVRIDPTTGAIFSITFDGQGGQDYNANTKIIIVGTYRDDNSIKSPASASVVIDQSGAIDSIVIDEGGSGYEYARAFIIPGGPAATDGGAVAEVILAPRNGHGHNMAKELGANALLIKATTVSNESYFGVGAGNEFRQFGIIADIKDSNGDMAEETLYIGPRHAEYDNPASPLAKISKQYGEIIYLSNFGEVSRLSGQVENIKVTIIF